MQISKKRKGETMSYIRIAYLYRIKKKKNYFHLNENKFSILRWSVTANKHYLLIQIKIDIFLLYIKQ